MKNKKSPPSLLFLLILFILFYCLDFFFRISPSLVITDLMKQYHIEAFGIGAFSSLFYLGYTVMQIPSGILLDRLSVKSVVICSIVLCCICFLIFLYANVLIIGLGAWLLVGACSAMSFISVLYLAQNYFSKEYFTLISGITIAAGTLSASFAQVVSAWLMVKFNWHSVFLGLCLCGFVIAVIIGFSISHKNPSASTAGNPKPSRAQILKTICQLLKNKTIVCNGIVGSLFYMPTTIFAGLWGISFLNHTYSIPRIEASIYIMLLFGGWAVGSPIVGFIADRIKRHTVFILTLSWAAMLLSLVILYLPSLSHFMLALCIFLFGLFSSGQVLVWKIYHLHAPSEFSGIGISLTNMLIMLTGSVFHLIVGWVIDLTSRPTDNSLKFNYQYGLMVMPIALFLAGLLAQLTLKKSE